MGKYFSTETKKFYDTFEDLYADEEKSKWRNEVKSAWNKPEKDIETETEEEEEDAITVAITYKGKTFGSTDVHFDFAHIKGFFDGEDLDKIEFEVKGWAR